MKAAGYLISTASVVLLAAPAWQGAREQPWLLASLAGGVCLSIGGMFVRWLSHARDRRRRKALEASVASLGTGPQP